jgi:hypothetical protein
MKIAFSAQSRAVAGAPQNSIAETNCAVMLWLLGPGHSNAQHQSVATKKTTIQASGGVVMGSISVPVATTGRGRCRLMDAAPVGLDAAGDRVAAAEQGDEDKARDGDADDERCEVFQFHAMLPFVEA